MMRIGIFGGSFNPIHVGHLVLAETAREALMLDRVVFIPTRNPPHKRASDLLPGAVRFELVRLAIRDNPAFVASDVELQRDGPSYSVDTVKILRSQLPQAKLFLLIGEDMLAVKWFAWKEIKQLCTVVMAHRLGPKARRSEPGVKRLDMPLLDISSTQIRSRLKAGRSIRYLVPPSVERYLQHHQLYQRGSAA